jgi:hypothetical protein
MAWAIDRMGRSLRELIDTIEHLEATGVGFLTSAVRSPSSAATWSASASMLAWHEPVQRATEARSDWTYLANQIGEHGKSAYRAHDQIFGLDEFSKQQGARVPW